MLWITLLRFQRIWELRLWNCRWNLAFGIADRFSPFRVFQKRLEQQVGSLCCAAHCSVSSLRASFVCPVVFFFPFLHNLKAQFVSFSHSYTGSDCSHEVNLWIVFAVVQFLASSAAATLNISPVFGGADGCFAGMSALVFQIKILSFKLWTGHIFIKKNKKKQTYQLIRSFSACHSWFFFFFLVSIFQS